MIKFFTHFKIENFEGNRRFSRYRKFLIFCLSNTGSVQNMKNKKVFHLLKIGDFQND